ncbi:zinc finger C2HC domain-containing protein 1A-like isoform X10 [Plodia interpunctella]|uniref:zinc finger C2HC domain-containing protein 1A-like isoform X10 n=1 Tax=Plodia interpunctella TaxID=58824 RepID=UPI0023688D3E|nr:zinc finger C2HC domain-containing protein 1A-like isoform X10 [Plodia interpunctella]
MSSVSKISLLVLHVPFVSQVTVASQVTVVKMPCGIPISFRRKKGKRHLQQQQSKSSRSRSPSPEPAPAPSSDTFRPIPRTPPPTRVGPPPSPPVPTHPVAPVAPEPSGPQTLQPCSICNRTFLPQSLSKHEKICEKMTVKKRKTFDSSRQRREGLTPGDSTSHSGTDLEQYLPKNFGLPENSPFLEKSPPNTAKATPKPKPQSVRTAITKPTSELQKCPHCSRAFGPRAFERHVEWCGDKAKILPGAGAQPPRLQDAKQRLNARTQYKAPPVRGRRSSQTRDKSSNSRSASVESSRGVSPPLPREYGDYRTSRTRASESQSSGEQCEPAHVPLLRPARHSLRSSGDAVRARQARLARDLSSSSSNNVSESIFPSSVKRSTSLLDSIQKKNSQKQDSAKSRKKADQLEQDLMQSLKDFDKFYESERHENKSSKDMVNYNTPSHNGTTKRDSRVKMDRINRKDNVSNGNYTPNGKVSNDSAYSRLVSLNRISPSKLSLCNSKEPNGLTSLEQIPAGSESGSGSSEEFLAMERSAELDDHAPYKEDTHAEKRVSSRASSRRSPEAWRRSGQLSSSGSETSLQRDRDRVSRLSRFCHECGNKFPVDSAKFCIQCGVKRLRV